jgi:hypothetical protein
MRLTAARLHEVVRATQPDLIHAHSPVLNALPSLWVGRRRRLPVVYEMRASWEDAAVDHGTTTEGSLRYRVSRGLESLRAAPVPTRSPRSARVCATTSPIARHPARAHHGDPERRGRRACFASTTPDAGLRRSWGSMARRRRLCRFLLWL